jgi:chromosome segregation ATPase
MRGVCKLEVNTTSSREANNGSEQDNSLSNFDYRELSEENRKLKNKVEILENQIKSQIEFRQSEVTHSEKIGSIYKEMHREIRNEHGREFASLRALSEQQQHSINKYLLEIKSLRDAIRERDYDHAIQLRDQVDKFNSINDCLKALNTKTELSKAVSNQLFEKDKYIYELELKVKQLNSELKSNSEKENIISELNSKIVVLVQETENLTNKLNELNKMKNSVELEKEHLHKAYNQMKETLESESIRLREALQVKNALENEVIRIDKELKGLEQNIKVENTEIENLTEKIKDRDKIISELSTENVQILKKADELKVEEAFKFKDLQEELLVYLNETESLIIQLENQSQRYKLLESKYNNLRNSKLGKMTVKYWSLKSMNKRKG